MADRIDGYLEVGTDGRGNVVLNHPTDHVDENGVGHIVFSSRQARELANSLLKKAEQAEDEEKGSLA